MTVAREGFFFFFAFILFSQDSLKELQRFPTLPLLEFKQKINVECSCVAMRSTRKMRGKPDMCLEPVGIENLGLCFWLFL